MDRFADLPTTLVAPARDAVPVTPDDSADLSALPRALFVGQTGHVAATMAGGQTVTFQNCQAGSILPVRVSRVMLTGTTAGGILALW